VSDDSRSQLEQLKSRARSEPQRSATLAEQYLLDLRQRHDAAGGAEALEAEVLSVLGYSRFQQGEHALSLQHYKEALSLTSDKEAVANFSLMIGANYANLGDSEQAFEYYSEGLRLERERSNPSGLAFALHHVGSGCRERKDFARAELFLHEALELYLRLDDAAGEAMCRVTLGLVAHEQGNFIEALPYLTRALEVALRACDVRQELLAKLNLAWVYLQVGETENAESYFAQTQELAGRIAGRHYQGWALGGLAQVQLAKGNTAQAVAYFEQALRLAENLGIIKGKFLAHQALYQIYEAAGQFQKALEHYKAFHQAERSLVSERAERDMRMVAAQLEADVAKREAQQLSESNMRLKHHAAWLERVAREDPLTGLYNRRYLEVMFREAFDTCADLSFIVADIDHFKRINDTFSHSLGDAVLIKVATLMRENCRVTDTVARYGGEEFVVLLPDTSLVLAAEIAGRIRAAVEAFAWQELHPDLSVTVSLGVAERQTLSSPEQLLSLADSRLYTAKRQGRNRVVYQT
jgi:diguanylate cyclase (GGDEF)-like protein